MYSLTRQDPLATGIDSLLGELFRPALVWDNNARAEALPLRVDVRETADAYVVHAELPGVKKDRIEVQIEGNEVSIAAEAAQRETREGEKWLRVERFQGRTARRFALPQEIDESRADAKFNDGVLELTLPKKAPVQGRKIAIQ